MMTINKNHGSSQHEPSMLITLWDEDNKIEVMGLINSRQQTDSEPYLQTILTNHSEKTIKSVKCLGRGKPGGTQASALKGTNVVENNQSNDMVPTFLLLHDTSHKLALVEGRLKSKVIFQQHAVIDVTQLNDNTNNKFTTLGKDEITQTQQSIPTNAPLTIEQDSSILGFMMIVDNHLTQSTRYPWDYPSQSSVQPNPLASPTSLFRVLLIPREFENGLKYQCSVLPIQNLSNDRHVRFIGPNYVLMRTNHQDWTKRIERIERINLNTHQSANKTQNQSEISILNQLNSNLVEHLFHTISNQVPHSSPPPLPILLPNSTFLIPQTDAFCVLHQANTLKELMDIRNINYNQVVAAHPIKGGGFTMIITQQSQQQQQRKSIIKTHGKQMSPVHNWPSLTMLHLISLQDDGFQLTCPLPHPIIYLGSKQPFVLAIHPQSRSLLCFNTVSLLAQLAVVPIQRLRIAEAEDEQRHLGLMKAMKKRIGTIEVVRDYLIRGDTNSILHIMNKDQSLPLLHDCLQLILTHLPLSCSIDTMIELLGNCQRLIKSKYQSHICVGLKCTLQLMAIATNKYQSSYKAVGATNRTPITPVGVLRKANSGDSLMQQAKSGRSETMATIYKLSVALATQIESVVQSNRRIRKLLAAQDTKRQLFQPAYQLAIKVMGKSWCKDATEGS